MVGFEDAVNMAEETHDPVRNFPRMMLAGLGITGVIYLLSAVFAVANSALINMLMASRLLYGMARQGLLPPVLGWVHRGRQTPWVAIIFTTVIALGLITLVTKNSGSAVAALGGTTALLLLGVFTIVNIAVLVLRRDPIDRTHFVTPTVLPVIGAVVCFFFTLPVTGRESIQYVIAGWLLVIGVGLWVLTWLANRAFFGKKTYLRDPESLASEDSTRN
jgi:amino acid transporter